MSSVRSPQPWKKLRRIDMALKVPEGASALSSSSGQQAMVSSVRSPQLWT